jgi:hypothetical protein
MTPYRIVVFCSGLRVIKRGKKVTEKPWSYAYMGWTPIQHFNEARLPSAGSFLYPGLHAVRREALQYFAWPDTQQVSIRTNQDKNVYIFVRQYNGDITGYTPENSYV